MARMLIPYRVDFRCNTTIIHSVETEAEDENKACVYAIAKLLMEFPDAPLARVSIEPSEIICFSADDYSDNKSRAAR